MDLDLVVVRSHEGDIVSQTDRHVSVRAQTDPYLPGRGGALRLGWEGVEDNDRWSVIPCGEGLQAKPSGNMDYR